MFVDRSVLEVYVDGGKECLTRVLADGPLPDEVSFLALDGSANLKSIRAATLAK
ncbi:MAG: GH32 C-terminal domain-containing protein [Planctomycetota bacterium]